MAQSRSNLFSPARRRFLELVGAGAVGTSAGLPLLFDTLPASAQTKGGFPKRLVFVVQYNGTVPDHWVPKASTPDLVFGRVLEPLQPHSKDVLQVTGLRNAAGNDSKYAGCGTHCSFANMLTGRPNIGEAKHGGISVDQAVAQVIGKNSRFRSVEASVAPVQLNSSVSATGPMLGRQAEQSPYGVFDRLFGELRLSAEEQERLRFRRKSVLDRNGDRTEQITSRIVGKEARYKLGAYHHALEQEHRAQDEAYRKLTTAIIDDDRWH